MQLSYEEISVALKRMHRFIWSLIKGYPKGTDPEDIYQDIVLEILYACCSEFDPTRSSLTTFMGNVARWKMRKFRRGWMKARQCLELKDELVVVESRSEINAHAIIWQLSEDLPVKQRVVVRNVAEGLTEEEIGNRLGIKRQAVSLLFIKAIKKMRKKGDPTDDGLLT